MRLLTRICPAILGISLPVAVVSLCVHVGCVLALLALGVCGLRRCECAHVAGCASMPGSDVCDAAEGAVDERAADRRAAMSDRCLELLATMGLTVNEAHAVDARVRGITSRQAADELGIRPSTVRAYGRRACVKLGVASLDDAATLVRERLGGTAPHQACESCGHGSGEDASPEPPGDGEFSGILDCDGGTPSRWGTAAMCLGMLGMTGATSSALLALLPYGAVANAWGLIWETAFGAGAGLLAWLGLVMARHRLCTAQGGGVAAEGRMAAVRVPGAREAVRACLPVVLELALLAAGAFATLWCQRHPNFELARLSGAFADLLQSVVPAQANLGQPLTVAATAAFSLACLLCLDRASGLAGVGLAGGRGGVRPPVMWALTAGVLMAGASVLAVSLAFPTRRAVMSVALGLTVIGLIGGRVLCGGRASAGRAGAGESCGVLSGCLCRPVSGAPGLAGLGVALAVAFAWEETWRGAAYASLDSACVAFLAVLVAVGIGWTLSRASWAWGACLAWAVVAAAMCWSRGLASGLVGACAITALPVLCVMSVPGSRRGVAQDGPCKDGPLAWHAPALVAAAGCFASVYAANLYGTRLLMLRPVSVFGQSPLAVRAGFSAFVLAVCAVILLIVVLVWAAYIVLGERDRRFRGIDPEPTLEQRLRGYLVSRGLTAFEADVVLRLAHGRKVAEVSAELSYARSTVAAARQGAYRKLGVHSREQLVALLEGPCAS